MNNKHILESLVEIREYIEILETKNKVLEAEVQEIDLENTSLQEKLELIQEHD